MWSKQVEYTLLTKSHTGQVTSVAIPGFEIPICAVFDREENQNILHQIVVGEAKEYMLDCKSFTKTQYERDL